MGDVVEFKITDKIMLKRIKEEAIREAIKLYALTGGFIDPFPPDKEMRELFELGFLEL
jgi:hypothetical protein